MLPLQEAGAGSLVGELRPQMLHSQKKLKILKKKRKETTFGCFCLLLMVIWVPLMFSENSLKGLGNLTFKSLKMRDEPRRVTFQKGMVAGFCSVYELARVCSLGVLKYSGVHALLRITETSQLHARSSHASLRLTLPEARLP